MRTLMISKCICITGTSTDVFTILFAPRLNNDIGVCRYRNVISVQYLGRSLLTSSIYRIDTRTTKTLCKQEEFKVILLLTPKISLLASEKGTGSFKL